jgi:hypothetical protein
VILSVWWIFDVCCHYFYRRKSDKFFKCVKQLLKILVLVKPLSFLKRQFPFVEFIEEYQEGDLKMEVSIFLGIHKEYLMERSIFVIHSILGTVLNLFICIIEGVFVNIIRMQLHISFVVSLISMLFSIILIIIDYYYLLRRV